jgi:hypothetical protein
MGCRELQLNSFFRFTESKDDIRKQFHFARKKTEPSNSLPCKVLAKYDYSLATNGLRTSVTKKTKNNDGTYTERTVNYTYDKLKRHGTMTSPKSNLQVPPKAFTFISNPYEHVKDRE